MTHVLVGPVAQSATRTEDGHRNYTITWHVRTSTPLDGPASILASWILPAVGTTYADPTGNDTDLWAFCTPELNIAAAPDVGDNEPFQDWLITQHWTTKPTWRCQTFPIENPLLEPFQISGDFSHEQRTARVDRFGVALKHPNHQPITGPAAEYKYSWPTITLSYNQATLPLTTYTSLLNKVNDAVLWGYPVRTVRFIDAKFDRLVYGSCFYYFRVAYTFEIDSNTFDKKVPAEGTLELKPGGNPSNPEDFKVATDEYTDENISVPLDIQGRRVTRNLGNYQYIQQPQVAEQANLLLLGIPSVLF